MRNWAHYSRSSSPCRDNNSNFSRIYLPKFSHLRYHWVSETIAQDSGEGIWAFNLALNSLIRLVLDHWIAFDFPLAEQGGVCAVANTSCCTYVNATGQIDITAKNLLNAALWPHRFSQDQTNSKIWETIRTRLSLTRFLPSLGPLVAILLLLFGLCLFNLLVTFVSSRIQKFQLQMVVAKGFQPIPHQEEKQQPGQGPVWIQERYDSLAQAAREFHSSNL